MGNIYKFFVKKRDLLAARKPKLGNEIAPLPLAVWETLQWHQVVGECDTER